MSGTHREEQATRADEFERLNARLQTELAQRRTAEERFRRAATRAEALVRIAERLDADLELQTVIDVICEETANALYAPAAALALYDDRKAFNMVGVYGLPREYLERNQNMSPAGLNVRPENLEAITIVPDLQSTADLPNADLFKEFNLRTSLSINLVRDGEIIGRLNIFISGETREFTADEIELLRGIAHQAAQAITNARLFEQVRAGRERLQLLSQRLVEIQELERRQLARELHDRVGLNLTVLSINLKMIGNQLPCESAPILPRKLSDSLALLQETIERTRDVMTDLRPPVLDDYGLPSALQWYTAQFTERTGIYATVQELDVTSRLPLAVETALFRITQEALNNVSKHAEASQVWVALECQEVRVRLTIQDNGVGFDPTTVHRPNTRQGMGLSGMRERAEAIGASFYVQSAIGQGTKIMVEVLSEPK